MRVFEVNILSDNVIKSADAICFTSNGVVKKHHRLVMGAGVAKAFRDNYLNLDWQAGVRVEANGNICQIVSSPERTKDGKTYEIIAFPTKHHWQDKSDIKLIESSARQLVELADYAGWKNVYLPAPGVSLGGLSWEKEVKPLLIKLLDDRFVITFLPKG